ncbi:MAG: hypothetical protein PHE33_08465 [Bacteroidales bacterium]|nr:hypothetical protein [Bacteroidales bacterium]
MKLVCFAQDDDAAIETVRLSIERPMAISKIENNSFITKLIAYMTKMQIIFG